MVNLVGPRPSLRRRDQQYCNPGCKDELAPICGSDCHTTTTTLVDKKDHPAMKNLYEEGEETIKELLVIGAGPHAFTLLLRLLEPEADLLSDSERHRRSEYTKRMRPIAEVRRHVKQLSRNNAGPSSAIRKQRQTKKKKKPSSTYSRENPVPPPISLETIRGHTAIVDATSNTTGSGGWMANWNHNFGAIGIPHLRSPHNAHADPYDFRSLEFYAELHGRDDELVLLPDLQRATDFIGPYQAPSTSLFRDFHETLAQAYGIHDLVQSGNTVQSIRPMPDPKDETAAIFEVTMTTTTDSSDTKRTRIVRTKRVVCAMGPSFQPKIPAWEVSLRNELGSDFPSDRVLHTKQIIHWLQQKKQSTPSTTTVSPLRLLVVGGGMTSAQLTLLAANAPWCQSVTLLQRSKAKERQFDLEPKWMGPIRGKCLQNFWSLSMEERFEFLGKVRQGGSIPPELLRQVSSSSSRRRGQLIVKEKVEIARVEYDVHKREFEVGLDNDDGSEEEESYDVIWLATGSNMHLSQYPALWELHQNSLPIQLVKGLPVLNPNLSWGTNVSGAEEPAWKASARQNLYCLGALAGLALGPDALNLVGARHGSVRVAKAIREDMDISKA